MGSGAFFSRRPLKKGTRPHLRQSDRLADCSSDIVPLTVSFLPDRVLFELLVEIAPWRPDHLRGLRDVPPVLAQFFDQIRTLGRFLELPQRSRVTTTPTGGTSRSCTTSRTRRTSRTCRTDGGRSHPATLVRSDAFRQIGDINHVAIAAAHDDEP